MAIRCTIPEMLGRYCGIAEEMRGNRPPESDRLSARDADFASRFRPSLPMPLGTRLRESVLPVSVKICDVACAKASSGAISHATTLNFANLGSAKYIC